MSQAIEKAFKLIQRGNLMPAKRILTREYRKNAKSPAILLGLGTIALLQERTKDAEIEFSKGIELAPEDPQLQMQYGISLAKLGEFDEAKSRMNRAIVLDPNNMEFRYNRALALTNLGDYENAETQFQELLTIDPENQQIHFNLGVACAGQSKYSEAVKWFDAAHRLDPSDLSTLIGKSSALHKMGQSDAALDVYRSIETSVSSDAFALFNKGVILSESGHKYEAEIAYREALNFDPDNSDCLNNLASLLSQKSRFDEAEILLSKAIAIAPHDFNVNLNYCSYLEGANRLEESQTVIDNFLGRDRGNSDALYMKGKLLGRQGRYDEAANLFEELLPKPLSDDIRYQISMEYGYALDQLGRAEDAFNTFSTANNLNKSSDAGQQIDAHKFVNYVRQLKNSVTQFDPNQFVNIPEYEYGELCFFVGFPRSGTTLMEQILASRKGVLTTKEQSPLMALKSDLLRDFGVEQENLPSRIFNFSGEEIRQAQALFKDHADRLLEMDTQGLHLVDKLPLNITELWLVQSLFPNARVIVAIRDPRDVVLSCFMQRFELNIAMINFCDVQASAGLYADVMNLWRLYKEHTKLRWMEYKYEELVTQFTGTTQRVFAFLDLAWSDEIIHFQDSIDSRSVSTPSYRSVTAPINNKAIGRWRKYEKNLNLVMETLEPFLPEYGFS